MTPAQIQHRSPAIQVLIALPLVFRLASVIWMVSVSGAGFNGFRSLLAPVIKQVCVSTGSGVSAGSGVGGIRRGSRFRCYIGFIYNAGFSVRSVLRQVPIQFQLVQTVIYRDIGICFRKMTALGCKPLQYKDKQHKKAFSLVYSIVKLLISIPSYHDTIVLGVNINHNTRYVLLMDLLFTKCLQIVCLTIIFSKA